MSFSIAYSQISIPYGDDAILIKDSTRIDLRFELDGRSWNCRYLSYFFINGTNDVAGTEEHEAVRIAMDTWSAITNLDFIEACNEEDADIRIMWGVENHGDASPFDNGGNIFGNVLAHGFFPPPNSGAFAGDLHFDDFEDWRINGNDIDVETVALHELGHSLGLGHSDVNNSVMEDVYEGERRELTDDDIAGIRNIYGQRDEPIDGPYIICDMANYTLEDFDCLRAGFNVIWSVSDNITIESGQGTGNIIVSTTAAQEAGFIQATIDSGCDELVFTKNVWLGKPQRPELRMPKCFRPGTNVSIRVTTNGATNYTWSFPNCPNGMPTTDPDPDCWYNYDGNGPDRQIHVYVGEQCSGSISVWASNQCGTVSRNFPIQC